MRGALKISNNDMKIKHFQVFTSRGPGAERSVGAEPPVKSAEGVTLGRVLAQHQLVTRAHLRLDHPVAVPDKG